MFSRSLVSMASVQKWWWVILVALSAIPIAIAAPLDCYAELKDGICFGIISNDWTGLVDYSGDTPEHRVSDDYCSVLERGYVSSSGLDSDYDESCNDNLPGETGICCYGLQYIDEYLTCPDGTGCVTEDRVLVEESRVATRTTSEYNPNSEQDIFAPYIPACTANGRQGICACPQGTFWNQEDQRCILLSCEDQCSSGDEGEQRCTASGGVETCLTASETCIRWTGTDECRGVEVCQQYQTPIPDEHPTAACITPCQQQGGLGCTAVNEGVQDRKQGAALCDHEKSCIASCASGYAWSSAEQVCQRSDASLLRNGQQCTDDSNCNSNFCAGNYPAGRICCNRNQCGDQGSCADAAVLNADAARTHYCFPSWWHTCPVPDTENERFVGCRATQPENAVQYLDSLGQDFACKIDTQLTKKNCFTCAQGYYWDADAGQCKRVPNRQDWEGNPGYCAAGCYAEAGAARADFTSTTDAEDSSGFCVAPVQYKNDHVCEQSGAWGSRTRRVAQQLMAIAQQRGMSDYEMLCDHILVSENIEGEPTGTALRPMDRVSLAQQEEKLPICILRSGPAIIVGKALLRGQIATNMDSNGYFYTDLGITTTTGIRIRIPPGRAKVGPLEIAADAEKTRIAGAYWDAQRNAVFFWNQGMQPASVQPISYVFPQEFGKAVLFSVQQNRNAIAAFDPRVPFTFISQPELAYCNDEYRAALCDTRPFSTECYTFQQCVGNTINVSSSVQVADIYWSDFTRNKADYLHCAFDINYFDDGSACAKPPAESQLAATLLSYARDKSLDQYTVYCDHYSAVLSDASLIESLNARYHGDPPISTVCVLRTKEGSAEKLALGMVFQGDGFSGKRDSFLTDIARSNACRGVEAAAFQQCRSDDLFWNQNLRALVYSPGGMNLVPSPLAHFWSRVFLALTNPLSAITGELEKASPRPSGVSIVPHAFDSFFSSRSGTKEIVGTKTQSAARSAMAITYIGFATDICTIADSRVECEKSASNERYTVTSASPQGLQLWRDFTTKLRLP